MKHNEIHQINPRHMDGLALSPRHKRGAGPSGRSMVTGGRVLILWLFGLLASASASTSTAIDLRFTIMGNGW